MQNQLYLCHKCLLKFIDEHFHNWLFEWVGFGHSTVDIFTPTQHFLFFLYTQLCQFLNYCMSGLVQKIKTEGGKVGYSNMHHRPTQNYSMWWYKSYLIIWERAGLPAVMKGARCSDIPAEARAFHVEKAPAGANPESVKIKSARCQRLYKSTLLDNLTWS